MSFYFFPLKINNRRYFTIQLKKHQENATPYNFIVRSEFSEIIFSLYNSTGVKVFANRGADIDAKVSIEYESEGTLTLNLVQRPVGEKFLPPTSIGEIKINTAPDKVTGLSALNFLYNNPKIKCITVVIKLCHESEEYSCKCKFYFSRTSYQTVYKIFDFGSEASQIATMYTEDKKYKYFVEKTIRNFANLSGNNVYEEYGSTHTFYQEELNDNSLNPNLYLSKFFLRKNNSNLTTKNRALLFKNDLSDNNINTSEGVYPIIDYLTPVSSKRVKDYYHILPNLKIASIYSDVLSTLEVRNVHDQDNNTTRPIIHFVEPKFNQSIYRQLINTFILSSFFGLKDEGQLMDLTFLVPNVYDQERVSRLRRTIEEDMQALIESNGLQKIIVGYEIHILSESDAAFLGTIKEKSLGDNIRTNDFILTIDCGKGTTDFSIIKKNYFGTYDSVYRGGIPGAGNTISYAFFETIAQMLEGNGGRKKVLEYIVRASLSIQLDIIKVVENLKRNFTSASEYISSDTLKIQFRAQTGRDDYITQDDYADKLLKVLKALSENTSLKDEFGFIAEAVSQLANNVVSSIQQIENLKPFKYMIVSGRGFLFNPLFEEIQKLLNKSQLYKYGESNVIQGNDLKTVSIKGSVDSTSINYDSGIIGIPLHFEKKKKGLLRFLTEIGTRGQIDLNSNTLELMFQSEEGSLGLLQIDPKKSSKYQIGTAIYKAALEDKTIDKCSFLFNGDSFILKELKNNTSIADIEFVSNEIVTDHPEICIKSLYPFLHNSNLRLPISKLPGKNGNANKSSDKGEDDIYDIFKNES